MRYAWLLVLVGCRGGGVPLVAEDAGVPADMAQADVVEGSCGAPAPTVQCPTGDLPFELESDAFENADTAMSLEGFPEFKDQSLDVLENPGADVVVRGRAARGKGLQTRPIAAEWVSLWTWNANGAWTQLGRAQTDADGRYSIPVEAPFQPALHPMYTVVEGLGECAVQVAALWPAGTKVLVTDIDETLTTADAELIRQISDPSHDPAERPSADRLIQAWHEKGYKVVYLTARPHDFRQPTRAWLRDHGYPLGPVVSADSLVFGDSARAYKGDFLKRVVDDLEWDIVVAYGNAESDILAYEDAGIPKDITFIIGEEAGALGTNAIAGEGYDDHLATYVADIPEAVQPFISEPYCE